MNVTRGVALAFTMLCAAGTLAAQGYRGYGDRNRQGFWIRLGAGYGTANVSCNECAAGPRISGVSGILEVGGTLNPFIRIGGYADGWTHGSGDANENMSGAGVSLYYYPARASNLYVKTGIGFSSYHAAGIPAINGTGWGIAVGAGYELPVGRTVALIPFVDYNWGSVGDLSYDDGTFFASGWSQNFLSFGMSVGFYPNSHWHRRRF